MRFCCFFVSVVLLGTALFAQELLPGYKNVKEGEVFVLSNTTKMGETSTEMTMEYHVDKIDMAAKMLTYSGTTITKMPGMDPMKNTMPPQTVPMTAAPVPAATPDPAPKVEAPKTDSVELTVKGLDGKDVTLKCTHGKSEANGVTSEFWFATDRLDADVKCGDHALKVHVLYSKSVSDVPGAGGAPATHSVSDTWTATDDLPMFAAVLYSHSTIAGPTAMETTMTLLEIRMP